ncbi:MAG: leucine-rich repeat domain-containing protein, partial [Treponemataceae bacterium]|nr:leucine-rich repeat domain-containing protein [Treponemataceae bacterium]
MKKTTLFAACMTAVCALALVTGCSSETDGPEEIRIEYDAGKWLIEGRTVLRYTGTETDVQVPDGVTVIGKHAFESRTAVAHVTLPDSVAVIEDYAFYGCTNLADVKLPESVAMIGWYAFRGCGKLTSVTIPASVETIENYAFNGCSSLDTVTYQGTLAQWCALNGSDLVSYAERVTIDGENLKDKTELVIPGGVERIGSGAFRGCGNLTSVTIPASVKTIGSNAFNGCNSLETVTYQGDLAQWCALDGGYNLMSSAERVTIAGEDLQDMTDLVIPDGVTSIGNGAFRGCANLTSVTIPAGVKTIGDSAFRECSGLTEVTIP